ncbi:hypothetical protein FOZ63_024184, partial [Perkinsus olseni]
CGHHWEDRAVGEETVCKKEPKSDIITALCAAELTLHGPIGYRQTSSSSVIGPWPFMSFCFSRAAAMLLLAFPLLSTITAVAAADSELFAVPSRIRFSKPLVGSSAPS